tara:strand:- start:1648 stop:2562 length:915 start_codon:yes stop_codon:yes gene_type:complete
MIEINVNNEISKLEQVVLGISSDFGGIPKLQDCYDPKSKEHVINGTFPLEINIKKELDDFLRILKKYNVKVLRPLNIPDINQVFSRDIAFVIEEKIIIPNIIKERKKEIEGINSILDDIDEENIIRTPFDVHIEGGDVILCDKYIFVGYSEDYDFEKYKVARTNVLALDFLRENFSNKIIKGFQLNKSDDQARMNALHLDCCFQPIGNSMAILYKEGFKNIEDVEFLIDYFGEERIIYIDQQEMYDMNSNIFSISEEVIVSSVDFKRLNKILRKKGFIVEEVSFSEIGKMEGLLRCSTMPLKRS